MSFFSCRRKGRDLNPRVKKIHLPDFESGAVPSWATFPRCGERDLNPHARRAHAPEACVSAVPPSPLSSIIHFLKEMPRKNSMFLFIEPIEEIEKGWENPAFSFFYLFITQLRIEFFLFCRGIFEDKEGP